MGRASKQIVKFVIKQMIGKLLIIKPILTMIQQILNLQEAILKQAAKTAINH
jgi:hypothetical protein